MKSYSVHCISEAISPITHASGTSGNESIVSRETVCHDGQLFSVPFLSGNALRHRSIREPGSLFLIDRLGLRGRLTLPQLNYLLHGGNLSESTAHENTRRIADLHRLFPLFRLLGGSLRNQIIGGSLDVWRGTLICRENLRSLSMLIPQLESMPLLPAERLVTNYQYTTGDAVGRNMHDGDEVVNRNESSRMIYAGQAVMRGAFFHHGYVLKHVSELELGALLLSLRLWQAAGGTIGGSARIGHGRLKASLVGVDDRTELVERYVDHIDANREECLKWLEDAFAKKAENAEGEKAKARGKRSRSKKPGEEQVVEPDALPVA